MLQSPKPKERIEAMFWIGLIIGFNLGVVALGFFRWYRQPDDDECSGCRAEQRRVVAGLEETIHGLKSTKGKLGKELQSMAFRNSGYKAR
jgi:hypothetical protein